MSLSCAQFTAMLEVIDRSPGSVQKALRHLYDDAYEDVVLKWRERFWQNCPQRPGPCNQSTDCFAGIDVIDPRPYFHASVRNRARDLYRKEWRQGRRNVDDGRNADGEWNDIAETIPDGQQAVDSAAIAREQMAELRSRFDQMPMGAFGAGRDAPVARRVVAATLDQLQADPTTNVTEFLKEAVLGLGDDYRGSDANRQRANRLRRDVRNALAMLVQGHP